MNTFEMQYQAKQYQKQAQKAAKEAEVAKKKAKEALKHKNMEAAKVHAETAIRKQNEYKNLLKLSGQVDAISSKANQALQMQQVAKNINQTNHMVNNVMKNLNTDEVASIMNQFSDSMGDLDRSTTFVNGSLNSALSKGYDHEAMDLVNELSDQMNIQQQRDFPELFRYNAQFNPQRTQKALIQEPPPQQNLILAGDGPQEPQRNIPKQYKHDSGMEINEREQSIEERFQKLLDKK